MDDTASLLDEFDIKQFEDISIEYGRLMDWFNSAYPEATIRLEVNHDKRVGVLTYKLTVMSGKEMADNQLHMVNEIKIDGTRFRDLYFMERLKKGLYEKLKDSITKSMNKHYWEEKGKQ